MSPSLRVAALTVLVALGLGLLVYPTAANWFAERDQASEITGYTRAVDSMPGADQEAMLAAAEDYNVRLSQGRTGTTDASDVDYRSQLAPRPGDVMAEVTIPSLRTTLPVYHGTGEDSLSRGIGHLYGTSLPVGGKGTHAVLSAHSGLVDAELFTHLEDVTLGELFSIEVVGRRLVYQVDRVSVVRPDDDTLLQPVPGEDYVTLLTCTPTGINTHRLLVRGHRALPVSKDAEETVVAGRDIDPGFPWWAVQLVGGTAAAVVVGCVLARPRGTRSATGSSTAKPDDDATRGVTTDAAP
ncbi:class C sortase [Xylanimonas sp. McL0601]|uniref:class C sortase n=1 Tax=Xylanimonas sp. McL0601 TaxID=3414739 RepID=UPI003CFBC23E